jgi:cell division septum initiation protein DivIVA
MRYTPVELRHIRVGRSLFGYKRHDIDKLLEDVADSFEEVWSERGELADKVEDLGKILADVKEREALLAATLVSAERAAADARDQAKKDAELIVAEAHVEARSVTRGAQGERDRLFAEVRRVETLLRAALGIVEETRQELPASAEAEEGEEEWPRREDTREFQAAIHPDVAAPPADAEAPAGDDVPRLPPVQSVTGGPEDDDSPSPGRNFSWG